MYKPGRDVREGKRHIPIPASFPLLTSPPPGMELSVGMEHYLLNGICLFICMHMVYGIKGK